MSELNNQQYEHYNFQLGGKTLKKWVLNEAAQASSGLMLDKLVILNSEDLKNTDFACMTNYFTREVTQLAFAYDVDQFALNISTTTGDPIDFY